MQYLFCSIRFFHTTTWPFLFCETNHFRVLQCQCSSCERDRQGGDMVFDEYTRKRTVFFQSQGYRPRKIAALLQEEGLKESRRGIAKCLARVKATGSLARHPDSGRPSRVTEVKQIERQMRTDDESRPCKYMQFR